MLDPDPNEMKPRPYGPGLWLAILLAACGGDATETLAGPARDQAPVDVPLEVQFLGVQGFLIRSGDDAVMTAPLYTNPDMFQTMFGDVRSDPELVDRFTADLRLDDVRAILSGHAHYDHLMDVPLVWAKTHGAWIIGNESARHLLAAFAPDRAPGCESAPPPPVTIPRWKVVAMDERGWADTRLCEPNGTRGVDHWINGSPIRIRALCSSHPDQIGPFHFGGGDVEEDQCTPPLATADWREGTTLAYLIDFFDTATGAIRHRIYFQDAPTTAPVGHVPEDMLAEKEVDVALLCVGNFDTVRDHPTEILEALAPRYAVSGHWESFFRKQDEPLEPLPFHDLEEYTRRAGAALEGRSQPAALVDGQPQTARHFIPAPGTRFSFPSR